MTPSFPQNSCCPISRSCGMRCSRYGPRYSWQPIEIVMSQSQPTVHAAHAGYSRYHANSKLSGSGVCTGDHLVCSPATRSLRHHNNQSLSADTRDVLKRSTSSCHQQQVCVTLSVFKHDGSPSWSLQESLAWKGLN